MKVLHLLSDWKWTGSSEPVTSLCHALASEGLDVTLAYRKTPEGRSLEKTVGVEVQKRGLQSYDGLRLNRYFSVRDWVHDLMQIKKYVEREGVDIVHTNLSHDHYFALLSFSFAGKRPLIVRTDHKWNGLSAEPFMRWAISRTDGLVAYSRKIIEQDIAVFGFSPDKTCVIPPAIIPYSRELKAIRPDFGIGDETVIGFAGRLKIDRGYDVILKAVRIVTSKEEKVKFLIVGRGGSEDEKTVQDLIRDLGLENVVVRAGYRTGDDYFSVMSTFDLFVIMRAGTDGTARALREAMSLGIPPVVSDKGMLPELVEDGVNGYVVRLDEQALAEKILDLVLDEKKRQAFGRKAKEKALTKWSYAEQASTLKRFYEKLLDSK